jgi:1-acyl-sn-glycerol-3-phosphate acyltransferase
VLHGFLNSNEKALSAIPLRRSLQAGRGIEELKKTTKKKNRREKNTFLIDPEGRSGNKSD